MTVVDAQVHVWGPETPERPWIPGGQQIAHLPEPLTADYLVDQMDRVGVDRALLVGPSWEGDADRNDIVLEAADKRPDRFAAIVRFPADDPSYTGQLEQWAEDPRILGARLLFIRQATDWLRDGTVDWFWPVAERLGLPVMVYAPDSYELFGAVAERHPGLKLALCHFGMNVRLRDDEILPHVDRLIALARHPNIAVKATSLPSYVTEPYPFPTLHDPLKRVIEAFGAERVFWGSDLSRLSCTYEELYRLFAEELDFLSDAERELVMGRAVCDWFGWPID